MKLTFTRYIEVQTHTLFSPYSSSVSFGPVVSNRRRLLTFPLSPLELLCYTTIHALKTIFNLEFLSSRRFVEDTSEKIPFT
jgi:hypothetical protein